MPEETKLDRRMRREWEAEQTERAAARAALPSDDGAPTVAISAAVSALITLGTMALAAFAQSGELGWPLSVGIVLLLFLHEAGHGLAARHFGLPVRGMIFIPFVGAAVLLRHTDRRPLRDAILRLAGPLAGALGSTACIALYLATGQSLWRALALINSTINLFNLAPILPLDGALIAPIVPPRVLGLGLVLLVATNWSDPICWLIALTGLPHVVHGAAATLTDGPERARWPWSLGYLALALVLALSNQWLQALGRFR